MTCNPCMRLLAITLLLISGCGGGAAPVEPPPVDPPAPDPPPSVGAVVIGGPVGESGQLATFRANITGSVDRYAWTFGDGADPSTSDHAAPEVRLKAPGTYQGTLIVAGGTQTSATHEFEYTVTAPLLAQVIAVAPAGVAGITGTGATFSATVNGTPIALHWEFGDGATPEESDIDEPFVVLNSPGDYVGTVTVTNEIGTSLPFAFNYTVANEEVPVITNVTPTGELAQLGNLQTFIATATNRPTSFTWNFGGGTNPSTSTGQSPSVTLTKLGTYSGTVTATNTEGFSPPFPFEYTIRVHPQAPVITGTIPARIVGEYWKSVEFTVKLDADSVGPYTYEWSLGVGGHTSVSAEETVGLQLQRLGVWPASVKVRNEFGTSLPFAFSYEVVPLSLVVNDVSPTGIIGQVGDTVSFDASSNQAVDGYIWNFDGGTVEKLSREIDPEVTLSEAGTFSGTVRAYTENRDSPEYRFEYVVEPGPPPPPTILEVSPTGELGFAGDRITFSATTNVPVDTYEWDFGNGTVEQHYSVASPEVELTSWGYYEGELRVGADGNFSEPFEFSYRVALDPPPIPVIHGVTPTGPIGGTGTLAWLSADADNDPAGYAWNFVDGVEELHPGSGDDDQLVRLTKSGSFTASVTAHNSTGTSEPYEFSFEITAPPSLGWQSHEVDRVVGLSTCSIAVIGNRPALAYRVAHGYRYASALTASPLSAADWQAHDFSLNNSGSATTHNRPTVGLINQNERPTILYRPMWDTRAWIARATTQAPQSMDDWYQYPLPVSVAISTAPSMRRDVQLQSRGGRLEATQWSFGGLVYCRAAVEEPGSASDWAFSTVEVSPYAGVVTLTQSVGLPSILVTQIHESFWGQFMGQALVAEPAGPGDWQFAPVSFARRGKRGVLVRDDRVQLALLTDGISLAQARVPYPTGPNAWTVSEVASTYPYNVHLFDSGGSLALLSDPAGLQLHVALTDAPAGPDDWLAYTLTEVGTTGCATTIGDRICAAYLVEDPPDSQRFALRYTSGVP